MAGAVAMDGMQIVRDYHERTKHHVNRFARSAGFLDWSTQPDPFRHYPGAPQEPLPRAPEDSGSSYDALVAGRLPPACRIDRVSVARLLWSALALSAWKEAGGTRWPLRVNPSSGNLHPTEAYLLTRPLEDLPGGVYHYDPSRHSLERRRDWSPALEALYRFLPEPSLVVVLTLIPWRESWKYGERAFRYCLLDAGHALAALDLSAGMLGWRTAPLVDGEGATLTTIAGLDGAGEGPEAECVDGAIVLGPGADEPVQLDLPADLLANLRAAGTLGTANRLSSQHRAWPIIMTALDATRTLSVEPRQAPGGSGEPSDRTVPAAQVIRARRSAVAMDGETELRQGDFYRLLSHAVPALTPRPFSVLPGPPRIALVLFVHRVTAVTPGLYVLCRAPDQASDLRQALHAEFEWERPEGCPPGLDLMRLAAGDMREAAQMLACQQEIAADGAFSCAMLARFEASIETLGSGAYRLLHWEAGLIGQVLYLEAEAAAGPGCPLRGTGIGCFFDDSVHRMLGLRDRSWQSLYHFTVGGALDDRRLATLPPYAHLEADGR